MRTDYQRHLTDLLELPDAAWLHYECRHSQLLQYYPFVELEKYRDLAVECGRYVACQLQTHYQTRDIYVLCERLGLPVVYHEGMLAGGSDELIFAEYFPNRQVQLHCGHLAVDAPALSQALTAIYGDELPTVESILLAHEVFHHLEKQKPELVTQRTKLQYAQVGPVKLKQKSRVLSELGAMSFTQAWHALPYSPYVLNYGLSATLAPEMATAFYQQAMAWQNQ